MKLKDWTPSRFSVLCVNHFEEQYIDRTGKCVKLREDAVPTMFSSPDETQKRKASIKPRSKRHKPHGKASQMSPAQSPTTSPATAKRNVQNKETSQTEPEPARYGISKQRSFALALHCFILHLLYFHLVSFPFRTSRSSTKVMVNNKSAHMIQKCHRKNIEK
ncbi:THAP domain-containing protein 5-like isoform X1 [Seriola lalandi dorsalis]|uniref:THAP domain-containing protein 5-like isoform X1 n=1 Tax=Seriola lalandi dorsalis TaxID=1841481 RepID=UPI000C6FB037|nr:THAP domain-containing protein 5-like isoform X1 [Seriola lalandi dorsalis]